MAAFGISLGLCGAADAGAEVLLRGAGTSIFTDEQGQFTLAGVSPGSHVVEARLPGFTVVEEPVEIVESQVAVRGGLPSSFRFPVAGHLTLELLVRANALGESISGGSAK